MAKTGPYVDWWHADPTNALVSEPLGRDSTGRYFDELYAPDYHRHIEAHFSRIIEDRAPLRTTGNMAHGYKPYVAVEGINTPLASDGVTVDMFVRALDFDCRGE